MSSKWKISSSLFLLFLTLPGAKRFGGSSEAEWYPLNKEEIRQALGISVFFPELPAEIELPLNSQPGKIQAKVSYTIDLKLQKSMEALFSLYHPDYGAFVAMDPQTGKILSLISYSSTHEIHRHLALRASFPSASVFKIVTAAAALEAQKVSPETVIAFNGKNHTLYKSQILNPSINRWTRYITLKEAFARSINPVFGRMGAFTVGSDTLKAFALRFGFNRSLGGDLPIQEGRAWIPEDAWGLAESASGFTRENTMSPVQGALIASAVLNNGVMMEPYVVDHVSTADGEVLYRPKPTVSLSTMSSITASEIRKLMKETVLRGTSRSSFRNFFQKNLMFIDVGGKTGSLSGNDPAGKYDWFIGYADSGVHRIAVAALTIHEKQWRVKSSYLARRALEYYYKDLLKPLKSFVRK